MHKLNPIAEVQIIKLKVWIPHIPVLYVYGVVKAHTHLEPGL